MARRGGGFASAMHPQARASNAREFEVQRRGEREALLQRLRDNDQSLTTLQLTCDAAEYMFHPSGRFVGSQLQGALHHNTVVTSLTISHHSTKPSWMRKLFRAPGYHRDAVNNDFQRTLEALRGCTLPLTVRRHCPKELLSLWMPDVTHLDIADAPRDKAVGVSGSEPQEGFGRAIIRFLECNPQLISLILDPEQFQAVDAHVEEMNRAKLLAFSMGFHSRLGEASLVRMLGCVRGDQDQAHVYDVPLLKGIGKHTLEAARQRHRATVQLFDDLVNLRVEGRDGDIVYVRIKMLTRLGELMDTYCVGRNLQRKGMLFLFDGRRLFRNQTPWELGMKDDDIIDDIIDAQEPINQ
jgi:hypothetical protein